MVDIKRRERNNMRALVALCLIVALIAGSAIVMQHLRNSAAMQDCLASGRRNCAPIDTSHQ